MLCKAEVGSHYICSHVDIMVWMMLIYRCHHFTDALHTWSNLIVLFSSSSDEERWFLRPKQPMGYDNSKIDWYYIFDRKLSSLSIETEFLGTPQNFW